MPLEAIMGVAASTYIFIIFRVEIFHLKEEYRAIDDETCDLELDRFLHYVSII